MNIVGACLLVAIGLVVFAARPKRRSNWAFAIFAASWGLHYVVNNLWLTGVLDPDAGMIISGSFATIAAVGLFIVTRTIPARIQARHRSLWLSSFAIALCASLVHYYLLYRMYSSPVAAGTPLEISSGFQTILSFLDFWLGVAIWTASVFWAFQLRNVPPDQPALARNHALLAAAIIFFNGFTTFAHTGPISPFTDHPSVQLVYLWRFVWLLALAALWLWVSASSPWSRTARNIALLGLTSAFLTALYHANGPSVGSGSAGVARILMISILAYGILRHQLLGIDVKIKWTIKQSTIAAMFIGLFFIISEVAAEFFSDRVGTYLGIVAAGILVFTMAPLQQFAQRFADKAMPGVKAVAEMTGDERARLYEEQVRGAWQDGVLSREEREMLERLRSGLKISVEAAHDIERVVTRKEDA